MDGVPKLDHVNRPLEEAIANGLMHVDIVGRDGKILSFADGTSAVEFASCSYFGLDQDSRLIEAASGTIKKFGIHVCVARSRFIPAVHVELEKCLEKIFLASAVTFPSVTVTHLAAIPIIAAELSKLRYAVRFVFDQFAHASMQSLIPALNGLSFATSKIQHNRIDQLETILNASPNDAVLYLADGFYSMGGQAPLLELKKLKEKYENLFLYIDDAHGTSIVGPNGCGYAIAALGQLDERSFVTFSLAKGFGCNGGGLALNNRAIEKAIRYSSMPYAFSGPLEYAGAGAALRASEIHLSGELPILQDRLRKNVELFDQLYFGEIQMPFSPVRSIAIGSEDVALKMAIELKRLGYYVPVAFYPVVSRKAAILRVVISASHSEAQLRGLVSALFAVSHINKSTSVA